MYTLMRSVPFRQLLLEQIPALLIAFLIAERFYKFHSFTLETGAFLVTWFVVDVIVTFISKQLQTRARARA